MGSCTANCNTGCLYSKEKIVNAEFPIDERYYLLQVIKIQSFYRSYLVRIGLKHVFNIKRESTQDSRRRSSRKTIDVKYEINMPGVIYEPGKHLMSVHENISKIEKMIGSFTVNEKEIYLTTKNLTNASLKLKDGSIYHGSFNDLWKKEGFGVLYSFEGGYKYEGYFFNDLRHGPGRVIHPEGYYYEGHYEFGKANGFGKYVRLNGMMYVGFWKDDMQHGYGEEVFADQSRYEGSYQFGKKNGKGKFIWADGAVYEGDFVEDIMDGLGTYKWSDGRIYQGTWKKNQMHGKGLFIWPDMKRYEGEYVDDKKEGYGVFYWPDNKKYEGNWKEGKQHGFGVFSVGGIKQYGEWKNGKKVKSISDFITERVKDACEIVNASEEPESVQRYLEEISTRTDKLNKVNKINIDNL